MEGHFRYINKEAYESRGYSYAEMMAMSVKELDATDEESVRIMKENIARMKVKGFVTFEIRHQRKNGSTFPVEIRGQIFVLEGKKLVISVARDISERQEVQQKLEKLATTDPLTGVYNRYQFELLYDNEVKKNHRHEQDMALILFDIDHFKDINDTFGHDAGDLALREFVAIIRKNIRSYDICARWGGEEFILLVPGIDIQNAVSIAETIRDEVFRCEFHRVGHFTTSAGVSGWSRSDTIDSLIKRADQALFIAKKAGRNRVHASVDSGSDLRPV
jgi:diguanylate cyclase (GGDEF)-like protein/PAS domain S-box-containing protein